jgi:hypothetical protein
MSPIVLLPDGRRGKFNARRVELDGLTFDSQGEATRWCELRFLENEGSIMELQRQVPFELHAGERARSATIGSYVADFVYLERLYFASGDRWVKIAEDFKGLDTALSAWKRKHLALEYHLAVKVTRDARR